MLSFNVESWDAGKPMVRIHRSTYQPTEFNPGFGPGGRFSPVRNAEQLLVATLYGSSSFDGAVSETLFHDLPLAGEKRLAESALRAVLASTIAPRRSLRLVQLRGFGLKKLGYTRAQLIDSDADQYPMTRELASRLYVESDCDGLIWMARHHDMSESVMLFKGRVRPEELEVIGISRSLHRDGTAWDALLDAADRAGVTIDFSR
jgi:hypothetical protein